MIKEIENPEERIIKIPTTSVLIGTESCKTDSEICGTIVLRLFNVNNPHKKHNVFPTHVLRFKDIEKVRVRRLNVSYYLAGPHIVINDLEELYIINEDNKLVLKGYQIEVEHRMPEEDHKKKKKK
jgi:hypothetical protein